MSWHETLSYLSDLVNRDLSKTSKTDNTYNTTTTYIYILYIKKRVLGVIQKLYTLCLLLKQSVRVKLTQSIKVYDYCIAVINCVS